MKNNNYWDYLIEELKIERLKRESYLEVIVNWSLVLLIGFLLAIVFTM